MVLNAGSCGKQLSLQFGSLSIGPLHQDLGKLGETSTKNTAK